MEKRRLARLGLAGVVGLTVGAVGGRLIAKEIPIREYNTPSKTTNAIQAYGSQWRNEAIGLGTGGIFGAISLPLLVRRFYKKN